MAVIQRGCLRSNDNGRRDGWAPREWARRLCKEMGSVRVGGDEPLERRMMQVRYMQRPAD